MSHLKKTKVEIEDNGPYKVSGSFQILDAEGNSYESRSSVSLCRCGQSEQKPFCDGTHEEINFDSEPRVKDDKLMMVEV